MFGSGPGFGKWVDQGHAHDVRVEEGVIELFQLGHLVDEDDGSF